MFQVILSCFQIDAFPILTLAQVCGMRGSIEVRDAFNQLIKVKEYRRVRSIDLTRVRRARSRPLADGCALEKLILWSAHRSAMGLNLDKALLCVTSLQECQDSEFHPSFSESERDWGLKSSGPLTEGGKVQETKLHNSLFGQFILHSKARSKVDRSRNLATQLQHV